MRYFFNQQTFNRGKLGKLLAARSELRFHKQGCKTLINNRPTIQGPSEKRKGTIYDGETKDSTKESRLIKFIFSEIDSYNLEFGDQYIRFWQNDELVMNASQPITNITKANPAVVTYTGSDTYANGDQVYISGVGGMTEVNGRRFTVANVNTGANTFELSGVNSTAYTTYTSGGIIEEPYEISSPYTEVQIDDIKYAQLGNVMYIAHPSYRPYKLTRNGATNWTLAVMDNKMGPVQDVNESATTITITGSAVIGGSSTWTASTTTFDANDVGSVWAIASTTNTNIGYARMTSFTSDTIAVFENQTALFGTGTPSTKWYEASWSGLRGYPRAIAFHEQRLCFGGTNEGPLDVFCSVSNGAYENFDKGTAAADDAMRFTLAGRVNTIQWLISDGDYLVAGTIGGLSFVGASSTQTVFSAGNIKARVGSSFGASVAQAVQSNNVVVYASSNSQSLYKAQYEDTSLKYNAFDLTDFSPDILENGSQYLDTMEQPDQTIITISDGKLQLLSYDESQSNPVDGIPLLGWYTYDIGGTIESLSILPTATLDKISVIVNRTIDGVTKRYVEHFYIGNNDIYVDSAKIYDSTATRTFTGLEHLEDKTVSVWGDGSYAGQYTVTNGTITIPSTKTAIAEAYIGLPFNADLEVMPIEVVTSTGMSQSQKTRVNELQLKLLRTKGLSVGESFDSLVDLPSRNTNSAMTSPADFIGENYPETVQVSFNGTWSREPTICIRSNLPFPATLLSIVGRMEVQVQ